MRAHLVAQDPRASHGLPDLSVGVLGQRAGVQTAQCQSETRRHGGRGSQMIPNCVKRRKPLNVRIQDSVAHVTVRNRTFQMDAEDLPLLEGWTIAITGHNYVQLQGTKLHGPQQCPYLYRVITGAPDGVEVDHISGDPLDNRKVNLRLCTRGENVSNCRRRKGNNLYKGSYYGKRQTGKRKWLAQLRHAGTVYYLGWFLTPEEAAVAYNAKALELFGAFARINVLGAPGQTVSATEL